MFLNKKFRKVEKELNQDKIYVVGSDGDAIINVKADEKGQVFSSYNFESNEKLNDELSDFIYDKAKDVPANKDIKIKIFTDFKADEKEVQDAIKNNYKKEYINLKSEMKRNYIFSAVMFVLGIVTLTLLLLMHSWFYNVYLEIILEIATWVFIWEAVDSFFLQRAQLKRKCLTMLKLYSAEINIVNLKTFSK